MAQRAMSIRGSRDTTAGLVKAVRKGYLATLGAMLTVAEETERIFDKLVERGAKREKTLQKSADRLTQRTRAEARRIEGQVEQRIGGPVRRMPGSQGLPRRETIKEIDQKLDSLNGQIEAARAKPAGGNGDVAGTVQAIPARGYAKLRSAATVIEQVKAAEEVEQLMAIRNYEEKHGKRTTVLRAIDERLAELSGGTV